MCFVEVIDTAGQGKQGSMTTPSLLTSLFRGVRNTARPVGAVSCGQDPPGGLLINGFR